MEDVRVTQARQRLDRLEVYIRSDPANDTLLIDAFETALSCRAWDRAQFHLQHGRSLDADPWGWRLREGDFWLAQGHYEEASAVLQALATAPERPSGLDQILLHNLAFIEFRQARYADGAARLASAMEGRTSPSEPMVSPIDRALQALWLRTLHHDGQIERAMHWATLAERHQQLDSYAAGIASLIATDVPDLDAAQRWSAKASEGSASNTPSVEALTTMASLALGQRDERHARSLINAALRMQPADGRLWSLHGFTDLLGNDPEAAIHSFGRALEAMPMHIATWHGCGWALVITGDPVGATESFKTALELNRDLASSHAGLAVALAMQGTSVEANRHAEIALQSEPDNLAARHAQALLSGRRQDAEELQRISKQLLLGLPTAGASRKL